MQISDRQPADVHNTAEISEQAELRRVAHKIAWARMNGSIDAENPFVEAPSNRRVPGNGRIKSSVPRA